MDAERQLESIRQIIHGALPEQDHVPAMDGIDIYGVTCSLGDDLDTKTGAPVSGLLGGDHLAYLDFARRFDLEHRISTARDAAVAEELEKNRHRAGILIADVAGHEASCSVVAYALHQAFLLEVGSDLTMHGQVTPGVFERINTRWWRSHAITTYVTALYGEIWDDGRFRFISAGHPGPLVYSAQYDRFMPVPPVIGSQPLGIMPSADDIDRARHRSPVGYKRPYVINELKLLGRGDVLVLASDGLFEHAEGRFYNPVVEADPLTSCVRMHKDATARDLCFRIWDAMETVGPRTDDVTYAVIKRL